MYHMAGLTLVELGQPSVIDIKLIVQLFLLVTKYTYIGDLGGVTGYL